MRWIRFTADGRTAYGIVEGEQIAEVAGDPFAGYERTQRRHALAAVKIEVPVIPRTFYCAGLNYGAHVIEQAQKRGVAPEFPTQPDIGYRANNALIAQGETVIIPRDASDKVQYEGELVVVIGKRAKHLNEAHESCHFCAKQGTKYQYFRDYKSLEMHFDQAHFACQIAAHD